jgi:hypothetical protein
LKYILYFNLDIKSDQPLDYNLIGNFDFLLESKESIFYYGTIWILKLTWYLFINIKLPYTMILFKIFRILKEKFYIIKLCKISNEDCPVKFHSINNGFVSYYKIISN